MTPADERRSFSPTPEALVRVDVLVGNGGNLWRVTQQTGDELLCGLRKVVLRTRVEERVGVALEQRHVGVHSRTRMFGEWLRHECRIDTLLDGHLFDDGSESHDVVGHGQSIRVSQVDLVLPRATLVMAEFHRDAKLLEHRYRAASKVVSGSAWNIVEVTRVINRNRALWTDLRRFQQIKLDLWVNVERETHRGCFGQRPAQHVAWVGCSRSTVRSSDVAEHAGGRVNLATPRQNLEGARVWLGQHVGFVGAREALNSTAVEANTFGERALDLCWCDCDRLQCSGYVGEPKPHELNGTFFDSTKHEISLLIQCWILS